MVRASPRYVLYCPEIIVGSIVSLALRTSNFDERATLYELQSCVVIQ